MSKPKKATNTEKVAMHFPVKKAPGKGAEDEHTGRATATDKKRNDTGD